MSLKDLLPDDEENKNKDSGTKSLKTSSTSTSQESRDARDKALREADDGEVDRSTDGPFNSKTYFNHDEVDYDAEIKFCNSCAHLAIPDGERTWECENPRCGTLNFTMGWSEWHSDRKFLGSIDWSEVHNELGDILEMK